MMSCRTSKLGWKPWFFNPWLLTSVEGSCCIKTTGYAVRNPLFPPNTSMNPSVTDMPLQYNAMQKLFSVSATIAGLTKRIGNPTMKFSFNLSPCMMDKHVTSISWDGLTLPLRPPRPSDWPRSQMSVHRTMLPSLWEGSSTFRHTSRIPPTGIASPPSGRVLVFQAGGTTRTTYAPWTAYHFRFHTWLPHSQRCYAFQQWLTLERPCPLDMSSGPYHVLFFLFFWDPPHEHIPIKGDRHP